MNFDILEFETDFENRIFYALSIIHKYHFTSMSSFMYVAALLFELLLSLHVAVCTFIFRVKMAADHDTA